MGLDQYAYVAARAGVQAEYDAAMDLLYESDIEDDARVKAESEIAAMLPRELAYWRKHPNLHGWMERLWMEKDPGAHLETSFNGVEVELTWEDLDRLEEAVNAGTLPATTGFFFGNASDEYYQPQDLEFIKFARAELFCGLHVFYNSSW